jgi:hypothetical protein
LSYAIPESTFGDLAEAHEGIASDHWTSISTKCYTGSPNPSLTRTDGSYYHRRVPSSVAPFEEPPINFDLPPRIPSSSQQSQHRSVSINPPKVCGPRPPTWRTSTLGTPFRSSLALDKHDTPGNRTRPTPVIVLPPEQDETPVSPLSPPPRFGPPMSDSTLALPPRSPLSASSASRAVSYQTTLDTYGFRERTGSRPSTSGSGYHPSNADNANKIEPVRSYKQRNQALRRLMTPTTLLSGQSGAPFIPFAAIVNPPPRSARAVDVEVSPTISTIKSPTWPMKIPNTPPQIPISVFVDPPPHRYSMEKPSPTSPLASSFRSTSSMSQYESFTPTFGTSPLPPLPAASRRTTYTSFTGSDCTFPSPPTSPIFVLEEETAEVAQLETL